jgi:hypothetical protein
MDPIQEAIAEIESHEPGDQFPYLQDSQGILNIANGDFFPLFWRSWTKVLKPLLIKRSFEATGIHSPNSEVVLKKFAKEGSDSEGNSTSLLSSEDWLKLKLIVRREVKDQSSKDVKKLQRSLHHIATQNTLLLGEVRRLRQSLAIKKRRETKSYTLQLKDHPKYYRGAVWWSPESVKRARDDKVSQQQQQAAKSVKREKRQEEKRKEDAAKLAKKKHQELINNTKKLIQLSQKGKRKASQPCKLAPKRQKRIGVAPAVVGVASVAPATPARSRRSRPIQPTKKLFN